MFKRSVISFVVFCIVFSSHALFAAEEDITKEDVIAIVNKAVKLLSEKGDEALAIITSADGGFYDKENALYAFVYDESCTMLAHPFKPTLVGQNYKGKPDVKGKKFRDEIVETALTKGEGWVDYAYQKPNEAGIFDKTVYTKIAQKGDKKYIVAAGMYKPKN